MKIVTQALRAVATALVVTTASVNVGQASTVIDLNTAVLTGGASLIAGGSRIVFDPNIAGEMATFTLPSIPDTQYSIQVTGQNNQSSSFFQFLVDPDGPGPSGFIQLGNNVNFGNGFNTITLATFTDLGTSDFFQIINGGTGNSGGQISGLSITAVPLPAALPLFVAGLGGLGLLGWRKKRKAPATA